MKTQVHDSFKSLFIKPKFLSSPFGWAGHIPFAAWLSSVMEPRVFVELGTHSGNSYFGFCQAIKERKLKTKCFAVDSWQGDSQAGYYDESIYQSVKEINENHFKEFSTLMRMSFAQACETFENGSIDLIHIDGQHTYEAVKNDFETWLPKMSPKGVMLFHDTVVERETFGVWMFWKEVTQKFPSFEFHHNHGLGVLAVGKELDPNLKWLFELSQDEKYIVRDLFIAAAQQIDPKIIVPAPKFKPGGQEVLNSSTIQDLQWEVRGLKQEINNLYTSNSWKLTGFLRRARGVFSRTRRP